MTSPAVIEDPNLRTETVEVGAHRFTIDRAGPVDAPLVLLLHGFPHSRHSWRRQLSALAAAGFHAVAPDQRGYSEGARPDGVEHYAVSELLGDALGIARKFTDRPFHVVGHDWGGQLGWLLAARYPAEVASLTILSRPHPDAFRHAREHDPDQQRRSMHHHRFLDASMAQRLVDNNCRRLAAVLQYESVLAMFDDEEGERLRKEETTRMSDADVNAYTSTFANAGILDSVLDWYRANPVNLGQPGELGKIQVPTLYVWGNADGWVGRMAAERTGLGVGAPYQFVEVPGAGHFLCEHAPEAVTDALVAHVARNS